ncbi:hypothetical protein HXP36_18845 [Ralstonia solanacearum]|nr:hypothetical protein [Ralstonia solanacearum]
MLEKWAFLDKTNQGRLIDLGCSDPSTYDPESDIEDRVEMHRRDVIFTISRTVGQTIFRLNVICKAGGGK